MVDIVISNSDFCYKCLPLSIIEDKYLTIGSRSRLMEKLCTVISYYDFSLLKMKKMFRGERFHIVYELKSQEFERVELRAAVVDTFYDVPLMYVAEYYCTGIVKLNFIELMRKPGGIKRIMEHDKNNNIINEYYVTTPDETDFRVIELDESLGVNTEEGFLEMIGKYFVCHEELLQSLSFEDVKNVSRVIDTDSCNYMCHEYMSDDYTEYDDDVYDEDYEDTNYDMYDNTIKADFYHINADGVSIGYYYVYEKPMKLECYNIMPATETHLEEYGIQSKIKTGKVMVACLEDGIHDECISIPSIVEHEGKKYTVIGLETNSLSDCKAKVVKLSETIDYIGGMSFSGCENLERIEMPETLKFIGREAFIFCPKLLELEIPKGIEYSIHCISTYNSLKKVYVHNSLTQEGIELLSEDFNLYGIHKFEVINIDK